MRCGWSGARTADSHKQSFRCVNTNQVLPYFGPQRVESVNAELTLHSRFTIRVEMWIPGQIVDEAIGSNPSRCC